MSTVFDLLNRIQKSPGMYLGYPSVSGLFMLLNGYEIARSELGAELTEEEEQFYEEFQPWLQNKLEEEQFYEEFQPWLQNKLGVKSVTSWAKLIMLSCHDEKTGFENFFELLDEFRHREQATDLMSA